MLPSIGSGGGRVCEGYYFWTYRKTVKRIDRNNSIIGILKGIF